MSIPESSSQNGPKFRASFSSSLRHQGDEMENSFKTGDFSSKRFTRKGSVFTNHSLNLELEQNSPHLTKIEGGFKDKTTDAPKLITASETLHNNISSDNSASKKDTPTLYHPKPSSTHANAASSLGFPQPGNDTQPIQSPSKTPDFRGSANVSPFRPSIYVSDIDIKNPDPSTVEVVGRHLVTENDVQSVSSPSRSAIDDDFDSLQLQGGDISREVYNWQREHSQDNRLRRRSQSFSGSVHSSVAEADFQVHDIRVPGGFRRSFLIQKATQKPGEDQTPTFITRNFIEFLTLYGHFAGEELRDDEDDEEYEPEEDEEALLIPSRTPKRQPEQHKATTTKAVLLLLKAFIGTGVLFLPRGVRNGGLVFSLSALVVFSILSYYCFMLLINTRVKIGSGSYGDIGGTLYGPWAKNSILASIVLSQIGFAAAYIVFTATNLQAFFLSVSHKYFGLEFYIILQLLIFIPLSLTRKIAKLSGTALVADLFILLGLIYVYYYCIFVVSTEGIAPIKSFNKDWSVFIGTAIFTYEGIGLLIPIQESMQKPSKFPMLLFWVMVAATFIFVSAGSIGYLAFGELTETVILLNFPQDSPMVSVSQFLYATAILLSTPLQLFPAIRILENGLTRKSGKYNSKIKWQKNSFRVLLVLLTAGIAWGGASDLDKFVAIIGSFACIPLIYIFPPLLHYKGFASTTFEKVTDILLFTFGLVMMIYTSAQTFSEWVR